MNDRAGELILSVFQQKPFQCINAIKLLPVEQKTGRIDGLPLDLRPPTANSIKVLECDSPRINLCMTRQAGGVISMILDPLL